MVEKVFISGDGDGEKESLRQIELVTRISQTTDGLSPRFGEGKTWHVVSPKFGKPPPIFLGDVNISERLSEMAKRTQDIHISLQILPEEFDMPSCYLWEIYSPGDLSPLERYPSECRPDKNLPGFALVVFCPKLTQKATPSALDEHHDSGPVNIDMFTWFEDGETSHDSEKPESVLLAIIKNDRTASLETVLWILESLHTATAKEIHAEEKSFKS